MNREFPKWTNANTVLSNLINKSFGVYITIDKNDNTSVIVDFINTDDCGCIPTEDKDHFFSIYHHFMRKYNNKFKLQDVFKQYEGKFNNEHIRKQLEHEIAAIIKEYEISNRCKLKDALINDCLGLSPAFTYKVGRK